MMLSTLVALVALSLAPLSLSRSLPLLEKDQQALEAIWAAAGKAVEPQRDGCSWEGVKCGTVSDDCPIYERVVHLRIEVKVDKGGVLATEIGMLTEMYGLEINGQIYLQNHSEAKGTLPPEIGRLTRLLWLAAHALSGSLPTELGELASLDSLSVDSSPHLSGTMPTELGRLSALTSLEIEQAGLTGTLPTEMSRLSALLTLQIEKTSLGGPIPSEIGLLRGVTHLRLTGNALQGTIPWEVTRLHTLKLLGLGSNPLSGTIPTEIGLLSDLESLSFRVLGMLVEPQPEGDLEKRFRLRLPIAAFLGQYRVNWGSYAT